jgi:L-aminopeptidase/D-esterase-like protein
MLFSEEKNQKTFVFWCSSTFLVRRCHEGVLLAIVLLCVAAAPRARDLGVPFEGTPGPLNAITDVPGVQVGQVTLLAGNGKLVVGKGPIRTGVTVILPRGRAGEPVYGGTFDLNGNGEMTGQAYLADIGTIDGPIGISNTNAIGQVYAGIMQWSQRAIGHTVTPVVAETWDGRLNDIDGFHIQPGDAIRALDAAKPGAVAEGNVGGGTGMVCFGFKGGIGTASRRFTAGGHLYTLGVLVQCNTGDRDVLRIAGVPVGAALARTWLPCFDPRLSPSGKMPKCRPDGGAGQQFPDQGSIIIVAATDAPLTPTQLNRVAKREALGLARLGSYSGNDSGDLMLAFSTAAARVNHVDQTQAPPIAQLANQDIDPLFQGAVEATEEAIVNALVAARTMTGIDGQKYYALPEDLLIKLLKQYNRHAP